MPEDDQYLEVGVGGEGWRSGDGEISARKPESE